MNSAVHRRNNGYKLPRDARLLTRPPGQKASFLRGSRAKTVIGYRRKSMTERAYFDWNATAPLRPGGARRHGRGARADRQRLLGAWRRPRRPPADRGGARNRSPRWSAPRPKNVTFTSGATEANMLALTPAIEIGGRKALRDRLFVSAIEHPSVRSGGRFPAELVEELPVDRRRRGRSSCS